MKCFPITAINDYFDKNSFEWGWCMTGNDCYQIIMYVGSCRKLVNTQWKYTKPDAANMEQQPASRNITNKRIALLQRNNSLSKSENNLSSSQLVVINKFIKFDRSILLRLVMVGNKNLEYYILQIWDNSEKEKILLVLPCQVPSFQY